MCHDIPNFNALGEQRYESFMRESFALSSELKQEMSHDLSLSDIQHSVVE